MDTGGARPSTPSAAAGASVADEPRDARVVRELLRSMGLGEGEYEPRVVHQFLDLAYRYVADVLGDAQVYADHAGKAQIDADDVRIAIQAKVNFSFSQPPPREVLLELARSRNRIPLPKSIAPPGSIPLPPEQDTLLASNYQLLLPLKPPPQVEETEDNNEEANPSLTPNSANPNPNYSQDQRDNEQQHTPQHGQRVSFQLNAVSAAAAKRPRMTMEQLNMG
ncbi:transcription initiation factor TFIID subunit 9-like [Phragmites australis]|uniref:transcription initiation factor TFIID subunit 9-like n=1 Tax=Phragmites australis TaxID=29695 RepID=UPI002D7A0E52|nr:transcription initiation factor TFIID subunit 9-like [Phragmites australis]